MYQSEKNTGRGGGCSRVCCEVLVMDGRDWTQCHGNAKSIVHKYKSRENDYQQKILTMLEYLTTKFTWKT